MNFGVVKNRGMYVLIYLHCQMREFLKSRNTSQNLLLGSYMKVLFNQEVFCWFLTTSCCRDKEIIFLNAIIQ